MNRENMIVNIQKDQNENPHWENIKRTCSVADIVRLSSTVHGAYANVRLGLEKLWNLSKEAPKTKQVVRLSLITIILTLVVAIGGCYAQKGTVLQYQDNQGDTYNDGGGVEQDQGKAHKDTKHTYYKKTIYTSETEGFIVCTTIGAEKLHSKRLSQLINKETIYLGDKSILSEIPGIEDKCMFLDIEVEFKRIATEYIFSERIIEIPREEGS